MFNFESDFTLSDNTTVHLNNTEMMQIHEKYIRMCTQEYLLENHPELTIKEAWNIACQVRDNMDKNRTTEEEEIEKAMQNLKISQKNLKKTKCTAYIEFCNTKEIEIEYDEESEEPNDIVLKLLNQDTGNLNQAYKNADTVNVSYKTVEGYYTDWTEIK